MLLVSDIVVEAKNHVTGLLNNLKNEGYYYHNLDHTLDVFHRTSQLAIQENINEELIEILQISALFHDTGFIEQYDANEPIGARIAEKWLGEKDYPEDKIDIVKKNILATIPTSGAPNDILEAIIKDADLDNLGRDDFYEKFEAVYKELKSIKKIDLTFEQHAKNAANFIIGSEYYTPTQRKERDEKLKQNKESVKKFL